MESANASWRTYLEENTNHLEEREISSIIVVENSPMRDRLLIFLQNKDEEDGEQVA